MISISLDAEVDTPERLAAYAEQYGAGPGWTFLTGDPDEITRLRHSLGAFDPDPILDQDKTQHAGILIYGCEPLGRWGGVPGMLRPERIARTMRRTLEARRRREEYLRASNS